MGFKFQSNIQVIKIEGHQFEIKMGDIESAEAIAKAEKSAKAVPSDQSFEDDPTGLRTICRNIGNQLNMILGPGAYEKIFQGRKVNLRDHMDVITYLGREMARFNEERERAILGKTAAPAVEDDSFH